MSASTRAADLSLGQEVVLVSSSGWGHYEVLRGVIITKVLATRVEVEHPSGHTERWVVGKDGHISQRVGASFRYGESIVALDDPLIVVAEAKIAMNAARIKAKKATEAVFSTGPSLTAVNTAILALTAYQIAIVAAGDD